MPIGYQEDNLALEKKNTGTPGILSNRRKKLGR